MGNRNEGLKLLYMIGKVMEEEQKEWVTWKDLKKRFPNALSDSPSIFKFCHNNILHLTVDIKKEDRELRYRLNEAGLAIYRKMKQVALNEGTKVKPTNCSPTESLKRTLEFIKHEEMSHAKVP